MQGKIEYIECFLAKLFHSFFLRYWRLFLFINGSFSKKGSMSKLTFLQNAKRLTNDCHSRYNFSTPDIIRDDADRAMQHSFRILSKHRVVEKKIDWSRDINSGVSWSKGIYYLNYKLQVNDGVSDIKVVWDKNRCLHLCDMAQYYNLNKEELYAEEIIRQIDSWIEQNPLMHSVNWTCSMEVAIRAINWIFSISLISESKRISDSFTYRASRSLFEHGFFIYNNLENYDEYNANHYVADLCGLVYLGILFIDTKEGKNWYLYGVRNLYREIRTQFLPSGFHYEKSISYHRLVTEMCLYTLDTIKHFEKNIPVDIKDRLKRACNIVSDYSYCDIVPNIGDDDDGRFLDFYHNKSLSHSYLIDLYNVVFDDDIGFHKNVMKCYNDVGGAIVKDEKTCLVITSAGMSKYPEPLKEAPTHSHNDLSSFTLSVLGKTIVVDPGTYTYTRNKIKRQSYRSVKSHNTICVEDKEQYLSNNENVFLLTNQVHIDPIYSMNNIIQLRYEKFENSKITYIHKRKLNYTSGLIIIDDIIESESTYKAEYYLHFSPNCRLHKKNDRTIEVINGDVGLVFVFEGNSIVDVNIDNYFFSESYGIEEKAEKITLLLQYNGNTNLTTKILY